MSAERTKPPARTRIAVEEGFMLPEVMSARAQAAGSGAPPVSAARRAMMLDLTDLGERRIKAMDEDGITMQLLVIGSPGVQAFDPVKGNELSKLVNDKLAAACKTY